MSIKVISIQKRNANVLEVTGGSGHGGTMENFIATDAELREYYGL